MLKAFDYLTGSNYGTMTEREICMDLVAILDEWRSDMTPEYYRALAGLHDTEHQELHDIQQEIIDHLDYYAERHPYTVFEWSNNELIVMPFIDDELEQVEECPESYSGDYLYLVNNHGNVDLLQWNPDTKEYRIVWSMV